MPKAGTFTALQKLQPIQTDFGRIAREEEELQFRYRAEKRKAKEKEEAIKKKISDGFTQDYATLVDVVTNTKSIDEANARGVNSARDMIGETYKAIKNDPTLLDDVNTQIKLQNLTKFSKNIKNIEDRYTEYAATIGGGLQDGSLSSWNDSTLRDLDSIFRNANLDIQVDPNTGLPIAVIGEQDENGEMTGKLKRLNLVEVLDGRGLQEAVPVFDIGKEASDMGTELGKRLDKIQTGFTTIEDQSFEKIETEVRDMVQGLIGNPKKPTDRAKAIWADNLGEEAKELTEADMKRVEDYYVASVKPFYDEKYFKTIDQSGALASKKFKAEKDTTGGGIQLRTDTEGEPLVESPIGVAGDLGGGGWSFTMPVVKGSDGKSTPKIKVELEGKEISIETLYLTGAGKVAYKGYHSEGKETGLPGTTSQTIRGVDIGEGSKVSKNLIGTTIGGGLNDTQLNKVARALNFNNPRELKDHLKEIKNSYIEKRKGKTSNKGAFDDL